MLVKTDFNEVFDEDYIWASLRLSPSLDAVNLAPGDWVELYDEDGETCLAVITVRTGPIITCKIRWETWRSVRSTVETFDHGPVRVSPITSSTSAVIKPMPELEWAYRTP